MKPRNRVQETFNQGGAWNSEDDKRQIMNWIKDLERFYCLSCQEFSILGGPKEFECRLCGTAIECASYDAMERKEFEHEMRRKLLVVFD
jgi:hypothetical protein